MATFPFNTGFFRLSLMLPNVLWLFLLLCRTPVPFRLPIHVVVGRPIELMKNPQTTADEVKKNQNIFTTLLSWIIRMNSPHLQLNHIRLFTTLFSWIIKINSPRLPRSLSASCWCIAFLIKIEDQFSLLMLKSCVLSSPRLWSVT